MSIERPKNKESSERIRSAEERLAKNSTRLEQNLDKVSGLEKDTQEGMLAKLKEFGNDLRSSLALGTVAAGTAGVMLQSVIDPSTWQMNSDIDLNQIATTAEYGAAVAGFVILAKLGGKLLWHQIEKDTTADIGKKYKLIPKKH